MAAHDWDLVRDLGLAQRRGDQPEVTRLFLEIQARQLTCNHVPNPERPERCYKCGAFAVKALGPGPVKIRRSPLEIRKVGT